MSLSSDSLFDCHGQIHQPMGLLRRKLDPQRFSLVEGIKGPPRRRDRTEQLLHRGPLTSGRDQRQKRVRFERPPSSHGPSELMPWP